MASRLAFGMPGLTPPPMVGSCPGQVGDLPHFLPCAGFPRRRPAPRRACRALRFPADYVAHQAQLPAGPLPCFAMSRVWLQLRTSKPVSGQVGQERPDLGVVVIDLHPVRRESIADLLEVGMGEFPIRSPGQKTDDVVEDEYAFHRSPITSACALSQRDDALGHQRE